MESDDIYESMIQNKGAAYRGSDVKDVSHYNNPIDKTEGRLAGRSRIWGMRARRSNRLQLMH